MKKNIMIKTEIDGVFHQKQEKKEKMKKFKIL